MIDRALPARRDGRIRVAINGRWQEEGAMGQVRYGIVGAGWIAQEAFMPAVAKAGTRE